MFAAKWLMFLFLFVVLRQIIQQCALQIHEIQSILEQNKSDSVTSIANPKGVKFSLQKKAIDVLVILKHEAKVPINVYEVTSFNKAMIPQFEITNFEFVSLSDSHRFQHGDFTRIQYQAMLKRVTRSSSKKLDWMTVNKMQSQAMPKGVTASSARLDWETTNNDEPILKAIIQEFGDRHSMNTKIASTMLIESGGIGVHFDRPRSPGCPEKSCLKLWIPLTNSMVDNLCLGMGDISGLVHRQCAIPSLKKDKWCTEGSDHHRVDWYQHMTMTSEDWIFFNGEVVPHYSANLGNDCKTQRRVALVVNIDSDL